MSELKAILATPHPKMKNACDGAIEVYPKFEADKVIAELEKKNASLTEEINEWVRSAANRPVIIGRLRQHIAELEEERRWRKYSEELPKDGSEVIATDGDGIWLCYKTTMSDGLPWFQPDGLPHIENITHWMPLPSAPKEKK